MAIYITKTDIKSNIRCNKYCFLSKKYPEKGNSGDLVAKLGKAAEPYFIRALKLENLVNNNIFYVPTDVSLNERVEKTRKLIEDKQEKVIYEAAFIYNGVFVSVDALLLKQNGSIDFYEFKTRTSSSEEKDDLYLDAAIQYHVIKNSYIEPEQVFLVMLDSSIKAPLYDEIFVLKSIKEHCLTLEGTVVKEVQATKGTILREDLSTALSIGSHCSSPSKCPFYKDCFSKLDEHGVHTLYNIRWTEKLNLIEKNINNIKDIQDDAYKGKTILERQLQAVKYDKNYINIEAIKKEINPVSGNIAFLDFETISMPIPLIKGTRAWEHLPFQFSCHLTDMNGNIIEHYEYLADKREFKNSTLFNQCAKVLVAALSEAKYFIAYNKSFELSRIKRICELSDKYGKVLEGIMEHIIVIDLLPIIRDNFYHKDLKGSFSIKSVLPIFVKDMSYKNLEVSNGEDAMDYAFKLYFEDPLDDKAREIKQGLLKYCEQDTLGMVEIFKALKRL